jgi:hypothetical protein
MKYVVTGFVVLLAKIMPAFALLADGLPQESEWVFSDFRTETFSGTSTHINAAVLASTFTPDLRWAAFEITCSIGTLDHPRVDVQYIYAHDGMEEIEEKFLVGPFFRYANAYRFDLIGSNRSRRPAAYNLGGGFVRNDNYDEGSESRRPEEYFERLEAFLEGFMALDDDDRFEVRFVNIGRHSERMAGNYFSMVFPMTNFSSNRENLRDCLEEFKNR